MERTPEELEQIKQELLRQKTDLQQRVDLIHDHARNPLDADSGEQAAQIGNVEVVSALESEAVNELAEIKAAIQRLEAGDYGVCAICGEEIPTPRLMARPAATFCVGCAD